MKRQIKYEELREYLKTLKKTDFDRSDGSKGIIKEGYSVDDLIFYKNVTIPVEQVIFNGMPFLVDILGNDLSVVVLTKRKYKLPTGRVVKAKFDKTIIEDCTKTYGTPLNGYWIIPDRFFINDKN